MRRLHRKECEATLQDYDKEGEYVKAWVPELASVPVEKVHAPFSMTKEEQQSSGVVMGKDYPYPPKSNYDRSDEGHPHPRPQPCLVPSQPT